MMKSASRWNWSGVFQSDSVYDHQDRCFQQNELGEEAVMMHEGVAGRLWESP